jgi:hypothetical protein
MNRRAPGGGRIRRLARRLGFDRSPMRRRADQVQAIARASLLAVFLAGAPVAALSAGRAVDAAGLRVARVQAADRHQVRAAVLRVTDKFTGWRRSQPVVLTLRVRWMMPDGSSRTGTVTRAGQATDSAVMVWVGEAGRQTGPPLSHAGVVERVIDAVVAAPVVLAMLLGIAEWVISRVLDRRRLAGWEADWLVVEPQWTGRR